MTETWPTCFVLLCFGPWAQSSAHAKAGTYNDKRTSVDRKKLSALGLMVKESYKTVPSEFNSSEAETDVKTTTGE